MKVNLKAPRGGCTSERVRQMVVTADDDGEQQLLSMFASLAVKGWLTQMLTAGISMASKKEEEDDGTD